MTKSTIEEVGERQPPLPDPGRSRTVGDYVRFPLRLSHGSGSLARLSGGLAELGVRRALIVASPSTEALARTTVAPALGDLVAGIWGDVREHVPVSSIRALERAVASTGADALVAIGGGSAIDTAKAVAVLASGVASLEECDLSSAPPSRGRPPQEGSFPVAAVPTTLSGAELTAGFSIKKDELHGKVSHAHPAARPVLVVHDPELLLATPRELIAASGLNALAHAVEHLTAPLCSPLCRGANAEAARILFDSLTRLAVTSGDVEALDDALLGSALSEMDYPNSPVGIVHATCHAVTGRTGIPHGVAYGVLLPHGIRFTASAAPVAARALREAIGEEDPADAVARLRDAHGLPGRLRDTGVPQVALGGIAADTLLHYGARTNARVVDTVDEALELPDGRMVSVPAVEVPGPESGRPRLADSFEPHKLGELNVGAFFLRAAASDPSAPFVVTREASFTYDDVRRRAVAAAAELVAAGVRKGDRVAFLVGNRLEFVSHWLGLAMVGGVLVAVDPRLREREVRRLLDHAVPRAVVLDGSTSQAAVGAAWSRGRAQTLDVGAAGKPGSTASPDPSVVSPVGPDDPVSIIYSSGTTGAPKGIVQTHANYVLTGQAFSRWLRLPLASRLYACLPLCHINAQAYSVMGAIGMGGSVALVPRFSLSKFLADMRELQVDAFNFIGAMVMLLLKQPPSADDRAHRVRVAYGVPTLPPQVRDELERRFDLTVISGFGMSETTFGMIEDPEGERRPLSVGKLRNHLDARIVNEARIVDERGQDLPAGGVGELWLRNSVTMSGYFNDSARTDRAFAGGWLRTGDFLSRDADGFFYFVDRADDVIRHKGENVASAEVETVLNTHPAVEDCAVVGVDSDLTDKDIAAFVQLKDGESATESELREWCSESLAPFKVPGIVVFLDRLPKTPTNKIRKGELRLLLTGSDSGSSEEGRQ